MKAGITSKLFVAFLVTNVVTAFAVGLGVRAVFVSGFDSYLREREDQRLTRLTRALATAYDESHGWDFLRNNEPAWVAINHSVRPPPGERGPFFMRPHGAGADPGRPAPRPPEPGEAPAFPPARSPDGRPEPRVPPAIVLDDRDRLVAGYTEPGFEMKRRPIEVGGKTVGWLAAPAQATAFDLVDRRFREEQAKAGWIVALYATALSAIVAWFLSRGLLSRLKRLASATRRMADGEYSTRVLSTSSDELGHLVDDFNRLGNALEKHEASRRNFMADVSHELRTPLAVLKGELEALEDGVRPLTRETLKSLQAEVAVLGKLVNDIHDLSLADVGGLAYRLEALDLVELVGDAVRAHRERFAARSIAVEERLPPRLIARVDPQRFTQLINNVLENSLRYTHDGGRVAIALRAEGNRAVLDVQDSEPGVPEEAMPRLFERLFRVEASRNRVSGGSGLGLAIARSVVEAHGGTIVARASPLGGLWIEVRLPLAEGEDP